MRKQTLRVLVAVTVAAVCTAEAADTPYQIVKEIQIGGTGGWDYITVDPAAHRVYVSHATKIVVADTETGKIVGEIADTPGVHGIALATDLGLGFTSNGRDNTSTIVDLKTLKPVNTVMTGGNPDAIMYVAALKEVYTFNGQGQSATVFDPKTGKVLATIPLMGKPEAPAFDAAAKRIYVNVEDKNSIAVIDAVTHTVVASWPLTGCDEPTGLAFDARRHRLFSVCSNMVMTAVDSQSGRVVATAAIGARSDGAAFDPGTGYIFSSNGEGTLTVAILENNTIKVAQTAPTQASARTIALDPVTHRVYLPAATMSPAAAGQRPQPVPDSFKVLVLGTSQR
jgi:DNA-binding beta-propeller fold protein YncE